MEIPDLADFLRGRWRIDRTVLDRPRGQAGRFTGIVDLLPAPDHGLHYREAGTLRWASSNATTTREYRLLATSSPNVLDWHFVNSDGTASYFFHTLDLSSGRWQANHPCSADMYRVDYHLISQDQLSVVWDVTGPSKDHLLSSDWQRIG